LKLLGPQIPFKVSGPAELVLQFEIVLDWMVVVVVVVVVVTVELAWKLFGPQIIPPDTLPKLFTLQYEILLSWMFPVLEVKKLSEPQIPPPVLYILLLVELRLTLQYEIVLLLIDPTLLV